MKVTIQKTYNQSVAIDFNSFAFGTTTTMTFDIPDDKYTELLPGYNEHVARVTRDSTFDDIRKALPQLTLVAGSKPEPLSQLERLVKGINL